MKNKVKARGEGEEGGLESKKCATGTMPFLSRHTESGLIEPVPCVYGGPVEERVWRALNQHLLKLDACGYFYPLDAMDAYGDAVRRVEETARRIVRGEVVLKTATAATYLTGVAYRALHRFHLREVQPRRATYRIVDAKIRGRGAVGEDSFDIDNYDGTQDLPDKRMCDACGETCVDSLPVGSGVTVQQLVESLPGIPWARERRDQAAAALEEIYAALVFSGGSQAVRAFRAYVQSDGDRARAAKLMGLPQSTFYRNWPKWLAQAREVAEKVKVER